MPTTEMRFVRKNIRINAEQTYPHRISLVVFSPSRKKNNIKTKHVRNISFTQLRKLFICDLNGLL